MTSEGCSGFRDELGPFVDGELNGSRMLRASRHLESCTVCADAVRAMRSVGEALRSAAVGEAPLAVFDGFASSVVTRSRAESSVSWRAWVDRACDGWHWAIVGAGSVAATFASTSVLSLILAFGPAPQRDDSLSALVNNLASPAGFFFVYASPSGGQDSVWLQVENGRPAAPRLVSDLVVAQANPSASEAELVNHFQQVVMREGRLVSLDALGPEQRQAAEALLAEILRLRSERQRSVGRSFNVHEMRLVTSTGVSAKQL